MKTSVAIIAAGGFGRRLGLGIPKSLINRDGRPMITHVLASLSAAGVSRSFVCNNRQDFSGEMRKAISGHSAELIADNGVASTIELLRRATLPFEDRRFVFAYGHAPRPAVFLRHLIAQPGPAVVTG